MAYRPLKAPKVGTQLQLYRNRTLKGKVYSLRCRGRVLGHWDAQKQGTLVLEGAYLHVSQRGRVAVRRTKKRNVHAWVTGHWTKKTVRSGLRPIHYDPFSEVPYFCTPTATGESPEIVQRAKYVV